MEDWTWPRRLGYGAIQAVGLGIVAGACEMVALAARMQIPLGFVDFFVLGVVDLVLLGILGGAFGVVCGLVHPLLRSRPTSRAVAVQLGLVGGALCALLFGETALWLLSEDQPLGAAAAAALPLGFVGVVYFNARYWLRRAELGKGPGAPFLGITALFGLVVVLGAGGAWSQRDTGGGFALDDDRNAILITVDGLRHDTELPALERIAERGIRFLDAVTPSPHATPANATVLTGLHPLRHKVLRNGGVLSRGYRTLPEALAAEGFATGGFVSSRAVDSRTGLEQGFHVFDDDLLPVAGLGRLLLARAAQSAWVGLGGPEVGQRAPQETVGRFLPWLQRHREVPFFAWVHLTGDDADVDQALAAIDDALQEHGLAGETLLVVAGTHGEMRGERGLTGAVGLYDPVVRVPLVVAAPGVRVDVPRVEPQVRIIDVSATVSDWLRLDDLGHSEGITLLAYGQGLRKATIWCALVGEGPAGELWIGMRNNGIKYLRHPDGTEELYDLRDDPSEQADLSADQGTTLESARQLMAGEVAALESLIRAGG